MGAALDSGEQASLASPPIPRDELLISMSEIHAEQ
jgi:hypothetical protein